jgi:hypothetical protein
MSIFANKQQVLEILAENLKNSQPHVVNFQYIAGNLKMSEKDTCQLMKIMHQMSVVIIDIDGQKSFITREGLNCVNQ